MPTRPARLCIRPRCPNLAVRGGYCATHQNLTSDKTRAPSVGRGYDKAWIALVAWYRRLIGNRCEAVEHGLRCQYRCAAVHHIDPVSLAPHRRLDPTNLFGACRSHHQRAEATQEREGRPPAFVLDAKPLWKSCREK